MDCILCGGKAMAKPTMDPASGPARDTTPPAHPGAIVPPVHETFGVQHFGGPQFKLAPDLSIELLYPVRPGTFVQMFQLLDHPIQTEMDPGFLADLMFYAGPGNLHQAAIGQWLPQHLALEGVSYRNTQITEDDYLALAKARVAAALGGK
jgi:hypothetical protein